MPVNGITVDNVPANVKKSTFLSPLGGLQLTDSIMLRYPVPDPPPQAGNHTFPTEFPPPRPFNPGVRKYTGGKQRGCTFNLGQL